MDPHVTQHTPPRLHFAGNESPLSPASRRKRDASTTFRIKKTGSLNSGLSPRDVSASAPSSPNFMRQRSLSAAHLKKKSSSLSGATSLEEDCNAFIDQNKNTKLHTAAVKGDAKAILILLENGADRTLVNKKKNLALHLAAKNGSLPAVKILKSDETIGLLNCKDETPFFTAAKNAKVQLLSELYFDGVVDQMNTRTDTPLLALLRKVKEIEEQYMESEELALLLQDALMTIRFLIDKGANVHRSGSLEKCAQELVQNNTLLIRSGIAESVLEAAKRQDQGMDELVEQLRITTLVPDTAIRELLQDPRRSLNQFIALLERASSLSDFGDPTQMLWTNGKNVLHLIAEEPDFDAYMPALQKHLNHPLFIKLLEQTTAEGDSVLHSVCRCHNLPMLQFLLTSKSLHMTLVSSGSKPNNVQQNALFCLALKKQEVQMQQQAACIEILVLLVKLFGKEEASRLARIKGSSDLLEDQTIVAVATESGNFALVEKLVLLTANKFI